MKFGKRHAKEYKKLESVYHAFLVKPVSYNYGERAAEQKERDMVTRRMNDLIKQSGAKNLTEMDRIVRKFGA